MTTYRVTWTARTVEEFSAELTGEEIAGLVTRHWRGPTSPSLLALAANPEAYGLADGLAALNAEPVSEQYHRENIRIRPLSAPQEASGQDEEEPQVFALADVIATTERALGVPVNEKFEGGGCVELWAETHEGYVLFVSEEFSPLAPDERGQVSIGGFLVGAVTGSAQTYLDGADGEIALVFRPGLDHLATGIAMVQEHMKGITQA